jgi:phage terminase large subunit-like protein
MSGRGLLDASIAEHWEAADAAGRVQLVRVHGEAVVKAAVGGLGRLRATQMPPPGDWSIWAILAGRGFGKTRTGAEWILELASTPGRRLALVGPSLESARAVMVEGESGLLARATADAGLVFRPSLHRLEWRNGSQARLFSGGEPDGLRGGQFDFG